MAPIRSTIHQERPASLDLAHGTLDAAVLAAYGWPADLSDDKILARRLALNLERAAKIANPPIDRTPAQP